MTQGIAFGPWDFGWGASPACQALARNDALRMECISPGAETTPGGIMGPSCSDLRVRESFPREVRFLGRCIMRFGYRSLFCLATLATLLLGVAAASAVSLNEIRVDQTGTDYDDYFELMGEPGQGLAGLTYVVIGDGTGLCGTIEAVVNLSAYSIQADGYFAACRTTTPTLTGYDVTGLASLNFENGDNVTHMLVADFSGTLAQDLDTNDDGVLDVTPWTSVVDVVGIYEGTVVNCAIGDEYLYSPVQVGPDGLYAPGHILRCGTDWYIGPFDPAVGYDSPGAENTDCSIDNEETSWGSLKTMYR